MRSALAVCAALTACAVAEPAPQVQPPQVQPPQQAAGGGSGGAPAAAPSNVCASPCDAPADCGGFEQACVGGACLEKQPDSCADDGECSQIFGDAAYRCLAVHGGKSCVLPCTVDGPCVDAFYSGCVTVADTGELVCGFDFAECHDDVDCSGQGYCDAEHCVCSTDADCADQDTRCLPAP